MSLPDESAAEVVRDHVEGTAVIEIDVEVASIIPAGSTSERVSAEIEQAVSKAVSASVNTADEGLEMKEMTEVAERAVDVHADTGDAITEGGNLEVSHCNLLTHARLRRIAVLGASVRLLPQERTQQSSRRTQGFWDC